MDSETLSEFLAEERMLMQRLLSRLQPRSSWDGGKEVNSYAVAEIPDWEIRQRLDAIDALRAALSPEPEPSR